MPTNPIAAFAERLRAQLQDYQPEYDWQPTVEPPQAYDRSLKPVPPPKLPPPLGTLDESRAVIRSAIRDYLAMDYPEHMLLVQTLPGTGKTTAAVEIIDELGHHGRIAYAGPRHDLYRDVLAKSARPQDWYEWLPRQLGDDDQEETCIYAPQISQWLTRGYQAMDFCSGVCGWDYVKDGCAYHAQKQRGERVIYTQHLHVTLGHPLDFTILFGDESPIAAFTHEWRIPARWIMPPGMEDDEPLKELLFMLTAVAQGANKSVQGPALLEMLGGAPHVVQACKMFRLPLDDLKAAGEIHRAGEVEDKPYFHLFDLVPLLQREAEQAIAGEPYPHRIIASPGQLTLLLRRVPDELPPHVIWLDATGRAEIYRQLFGRPVKVVRAAPRLQGTIYQVVDRANGKSAIIQAGRRTSKGDQSLELVEAIIAKYGYQRPSVISFKDFVSGLDLEDVKTGHFYAARGTNEHEDADAVIILGAPQANIYDIVKAAKMIYFDRDRAFAVKWVTREQQYDYIDPVDGLGRTYPVSGFWADPDLQAVLETIREDEIIQAAHRGRPVNHPVDIWLLTNIPLPGLPPDRLLTMREILGAPDGVHIFKWRQVQALMETRDQITVSDLIEIGVHRNTARDYLTRIAEMDGWEAGAIKTKGRPKKAAIKKLLHKSVKNNT